MSHTYRQSSQSNPQLDEKDFDNHLLARQTRVRVDAEVVRDTALEVSGLLVEKFGGPSVKPYQPDGYLAALNFPKREYAASQSATICTGAASTRIGSARSCIRAWRLSTRRRARNARSTG